VSWDSFLEFLKCFNPVKIINELIDKQPRTEIVVAVVNLFFLLGVLALVVAFAKVLYSEDLIAGVGLPGLLNFLIVGVFSLLFSYWFCCMMIFAASKFSPEKQN